MRIAILSRGQDLHSIRRLLKEAKLARVKCEIIDPVECQMIIEGKKTRMVYGNKELERFDALLPRIGASLTDWGLAVVTHFQTMGTYVANPAQAISDSRDKFRCLQLLSKARLATPATILTRSARGREVAVNAAGGYPTVLKVLRGTQGVGVMLIPSPVALNSVLDTFRSMDEDVLIQQFITEGAGRDFRAFIIGDKVVAAMMRTAPKGEFRSNIHRGGKGLYVKLPKNYERVAIRAAKVMGLSVAGVDLMASNKGPVILEVNSSPGFEGIEKATGINIARMIVRHLISKARKRRRRR